MKSQTKKILKVSGIILGALTAVAGILIAVVLNFIFTSEKLTPIVLEAANRNLNAKLDMKSVELTFFSTFPRFGVQLTDGTLVSTFGNGSIHQMGAAAQNAPACNGWMYWHYRNEKKELVAIDELRKIIREELYPE